VRELNRETKGAFSLRALTG